MRTDAKRVNWDYLITTGVSAAYMSALFAVGGLVVMCLITIDDHVTQRRVVQADTLAEFIAETKSPQCVKGELGKILSEQGKILRYQLDDTEKNCQMLALLAE